MEKIFGRMDGNDIQRDYIDEAFWFNLYESTRLEKVYPFTDGDTYFTIEDGQVVESTWDCVSEEMFDEDVKGKMFYFKSKEDAVEFLKQTH